MMYEMWNHLVQSTVCAGAAGALALALRAHQAKGRYWIWTAASAKFLLPFSLLVAIGGQFGWMHTQNVSQPMISYAIEEISQPFPFLPGPHDLTQAHGAMADVGAVIGAIWALGAAAILFRWMVRWRRIARLVREASVLHSGREVAALRRLGSRMEIRCSDARMEPGVYGIVRPVLLWPAGISDRLNDAQVEAIIVHELSHVRRGDNFFGALHMLVEALFWFHPLVWWMGSRLIEERERACDEDVLRHGGEARAYAESILETCRFCMESRLACVAGVTGSDLRERIERIMTNRAVRVLDGGRKMLLAGAAFAAVAGPVAIGMAHAPRLRAQEAKNDMAFDVASIKFATPGLRGFSSQVLPGGGYSAKNITLKELIGEAYRIYDFQISGGPAWLSSQRFNVDAKPDAKAHPNNEQIRAMLRSLLTERFQLKIRQDTKELPVYALAAAKGGAKLAAAKEPGSEPYFRTIQRRQIIAKNARLEMLADALSTFMGRPVVDKRRRVRLRA